MKYQVTTIDGRKETKLYREIDASILPPREGWYLTNLGDTQLAWIGDGVNGDGPNKELMWCSRGRGHVNKWYEAIPLQSKQDAIDILIEQGKQYESKQDSEDELWEEAAMKLFEKHNPGQNIEKLVNWGIYQGMVKDMRFLSKTYTITKK